MAKLSLREAVKIFDVSRPTLTKAINSGNLSGVRNGKGQWEIDPSELSRVYKTRSTEQIKDDASEQGKFIPENASLSGELAELKANLALAEARAEAAERLAQERAERIEDLRRMLPTPNPGTKTKKWWWWS